jgi:hypothetical protein
LTSGEVFTQDFFTAKTRRTAFCKSAFISVDPGKLFLLKRHSPLLAYPARLSFAPGNRRLYIWQINLGD